MGHTINKEKLLMKLKYLSLPLLILSASFNLQAADLSEDDKFSYGLGMLIGERVLKQYGDVNYEVLIQAIKAQHQGQDTLLTVQEAQAALASYNEAKAASQHAGAKEAGVAYLAENAKKEGVTTTASGLQYSVMTEGSGAKPAATDEVTVHYRGTLLNGTEFDSSYSRGQPASFALNQVIPGWTEGVQLMSIGSKYQFTIPYNLAYGERGAGANIGPFQTLIFEVELISIK
jgi:FKBP-type peptidyl-prolyl cis-trans isomerase